MFLIICTEFGFCDHEVLITNRGNYTWPETAGDNEVELECQLGPAAAIGRRRCDTSGEWEDPQLENCTTLIALQLQQLEEELNNVVTDICLTNSVLIIALFPFFPPVCKKIYMGVGGASE